MLNKGRIIQLSLMLLLLLALVVWRTLDSMQADAADAAIKEGETALLRCDYFSPCELITEQGRFYLTVANPPIRAEQWIDFNLQSELQEWRVTEAKIIGKEMFMGRIPVSFSPLEKGYSAKTLVGACTSQKMIWQLQITVEINGLSQLLRFDFVVTH